MISNDLYTYTLNILSDKIRHEIEKEQAKARFYHNADDKAHDSRNRDDNVYWFRFHSRTPDGQHVTQTSQAPCETFLVVLKKKEKYENFLMKEY